MASQQIKARRRALALRRLLEVQVRLAALLELQVPETRATNRDAELAQIQETESVAGFLESLDARLSERLATVAVGLESAPEVSAVERSAAAMPVAVRGRRAIARRGGA